MKYRNLSREALLVLSVLLLIVVGCGGGNGNAVSRSTPVTISIAWGARSRAINAPASALSATITLKNARPDQTDFTFTVNRKADPAAYTQSYTSPEAAGPSQAGIFPLILRFYAQPDGGGSVVATAQNIVVIRADGTGIGDVSLTGTVARVTVSTEQSIAVGEKKDLIFSAWDAQNALVAVTAGSATLQVTAGNDRLRITNGQMEGIGIGTASVTATVDNKSSVPVTVSVVFPVTAVFAEATSENNQAAVRITWGDNVFGQANVLQYKVYRNPDFPYGPNLAGHPAVIPIGTTAFHTLMDRPSPNFPYSNGGSVLVAAPGGGLCGTLVGVALIDTGFHPGSTYQYLASAITAPSSGSTGGGSGDGTGGSPGGGTIAGCLETDPIAGSYATPITPVALTAPAEIATGIDLTAFAPTWGSRKGADVFQLEVSTDRTFSNPNIIFHIGPIASTSPNADGVPQSIAPIDLKTQAVLLADPIFANYVQQGSGAGIPTIYWRVGARHDSDQPGPVHWITRSAKDTDRTFRWVYSLPRRFTP